MINKEIMKGIKSRSNWLSRDFPKLGYEDLVQEGILCVLEVQKKDPCASVSFIMASVNHKYSYILRKAAAERKRFVPLEDRHIQEIGFDPTSIMENCLSASEVLNKLSGEEHVVASLILLQEMSNRKISKVLGCSPATVGRIVERIRERVRNER